jgi:hypothetical protein
MRLEGPRNGLSLVDLPGYGQVSERSGPSASRACGDGPVQRGERLHHIGVACSHDRSQLRAR